ncbi:MAG: ABC-2 family transporter protein [Chloroflexi bacterium]|nr:ABC-2 family transporter protein [Chloroflexota bacterium]
MHLALIRLSFRRQMTYRAAALAGLATNAFFGVLHAYIMTALFGARDSVAGYTIPGVVTYVALTQALIGIIATWGWWDVVNSIRTGDIGGDLARPIDYFTYWCMRDIGRGLAQFLLRGVTIMILMAIFFPIVLPPSAAHWLATILSLALALLCSFAWRFLYSLTAFWSQDAVGVSRFAMSLATFLSGFLMPIALMPDWAGSLMRLTPFPAMVNTPIEIYLGIVPVEVLPFALVQQAFWFVVLAACAQSVLALGVRKLVIQGG